MKDSSYLYKCLSPNLGKMTYEAALHHKIEQANKLLAELIEVYYTERDTARINQIIKAISFNRTLLSELI